jgi:hypothetical protein
MRIIKKKNRNKKLDINFCSKQEEFPDVPIEQPKNP